MEPPVTRPTLSVVHANYNHGKYIAQAVEAIVTQSRPPDEYIILDDGSTDNSVEIIDSFAARHAYIRVVKNERNLGLMANTPRLLGMAQGDYLYTAASDDHILPGFFEKSMRLLERFPQAGMCCSYTGFYDHQGALISQYRPPWSNQPCYFSPNELAAIIGDWTLVAPSAIYKRSALEEAGGLITELKWLCDFFLNLVIAFRQGICFFPEFSAYVTFVPNNYASGMFQKKQEHRAVLSHLLDLLNSLAYRDVLPSFQRSGVLAFFCSDITRVVLSNPKHWNVATLKLIRRAAIKEAKRLNRRVWSKAGQKLGRIMPHAQQTSSPG